MNPKSSLNDRLNQIKPEGVSLTPEDAPTLTKQLYSLDIQATEKQLEHVKSQLRRLGVKYSVREV